MADEPETAPPSPTAEPVAQVETPLPPAEPVKVSLVDHVGPSLAYHVKRCQKKAAGEVIDEAALRYLVGDLILTERTSILESLTAAEQAVIKPIALKLKGAMA